MAEQEACAELVEKATEETKKTSGKIEGESLLLPLLQGLLQAPENDQTPDSGTESGEDQRIGLIAEVQNALDKLSASLCSNATDITPERRASLLHLVTKLQAGLATSCPNMERRSSQGQGRFNKRRQRQNRHTVGVSSEELADARRLMEEISLHEPPVEKSPVAGLQKQKSESSVNQNSSASSSSSMKHLFANKSTAVKNAVAKPFSSSNSISQSISGQSSCVQTPTDCLGFLFDEDPQEIQRQESAKSIQEAVQNAAAKKVKHNSESTHESEPEVDSRENTPLLSNPIYKQPESERERQQDLEEKMNRFNSKKLKMKRANTIDIPKPLNFYEDDDEEESEDENLTAEEKLKRRNTYYALRGPIKIGNAKSQNQMPVFEARTDNDKKFLAFINKHNETPVSKPAWTVSSKTPVWENKFGNIKSNFEKPQSAASKSSARAFWKASDDAVYISGSSNQFGPKISRESARNLQQMFEEKQKQSSWKNDPKNVVNGSLKFSPKAMENDKPKSKHVPQPNAVNQFSHAPQSAFKPVQKPTNLQITPQTEVIKCQLKGNDLDSPVYLYSPKPLFSPPSNGTTPSPLTTKPWAAAPSGESRVLSLAASKFENPQPQGYKPRRPSKDSGNKVAIPSYLQNRSDNAPKYTAPYLGKGSEAKSNTVRKLSDQYDSIKTSTVPKQPVEFSCQTSVKYVSPSAQKYQPNNYQNQNYQNQNYQNQNYHSQNYQNQGYQNQNYQNQGYQNQNYQTPPQAYQQNYNYQYPQHNYQSQQSYPSQQNYQSSVNYQAPNSFKAPQQNYQSSQAPQQNYQTVQQNYQQPKNYQAPPQSYQPPQQNYQQSQQNYQKPSAQNYSKSFPISQPKAPQQIYQHVPGRNDQFDQKDDNNNNQFTSNYQFTPNRQITSPKAQPIKPQTPLSSQTGIQQGNYKAPEPTETRPQYETQVSQESVKEYNAINSKVMSGPVSQQAVTVKQKSPMSREGHDMEAALNLRNTLQKVNKFESLSPNNSFKYKSESKSPVNSPISKSSDSSPARSPNFIMNNVKEAPIVPKNFGVVKPMQQKPKSIESLEVNDKGESVVTSQFQIPVISVSNKDPIKPPSLTKVLSKSDSWHQICLAQQAPQHKPPSPSNRPVMKSKSSHSLAVPKQFEAGMSKDEMALKRKTMEAYLIGGDNKSTQKIETQKVVKRSINRVKTSEKTSAFKSTGLSRSRTLPDMVCPELLDESNVDQAFEDLFKSSS